MRLDLLLLHQLCIGAVIHHTLAEDWGAKRAVYFLRIDIFQLRIEDEFISLLAQTHGRLFSQEDKSKNIAILALSQYLTVTQMWRIDRDRTFSRQLKKNL